MYILSEGLMWLDMLAETQTGQSGGETKGKEDRHVKHIPGEATLVHW